jgi:hypothetical protein
MLFKRLTSEMTLSDLERLISILGGRRALRGLKRRLAPGEASTILEADLSSTLLRQLALLMPPDSSNATGEGNPTSSAAVEGTTSVTSVQESAVPDAAAEVATPSKTLDIFTFKEEQPTKDLSF